MSWTFHNRNSASGPFEYESRMLLHVRLRHASAPVPSATPLNVATTPGVAETTFAVTLCFHVRPICHWRILTKGRKYVYITYKF